MKTFNSNLLLGILLAISNYCIATVVEIVGEDQFNNVVLASNKPVVVKVGATWCPACVRSANPFHALSENPEYANVVFAEMDTDKNDKLSNKYHVQSLPTFLYFNNGQLVNTKTGFAEREVKDVLGSMLSGGAAMEKKTEAAAVTGAAAAATAEASEQAQSGCDLVPQNFFERAYNAVRDFFVSIGDTVSGWFK